MHYYRPLTQSEPVKPYHEFEILFIYRDIFDAKAVLNYVKDSANVKSYTWHNSYSVKILTIRSKEEIKDALNFARPIFSDDCKL